MAAVKAFTAGGVGAQPNVDDVSRVAHGLPVALDHAGAERIKKESPAPKAFAAETDLGQQPAANSASLDAAHTRAFLATRLLMLMNGKSGVRLAVAEFLRDLLNHQQLLPAVPADGGEQQAAAALVMACKGHGTTSSGKQLSDTLAEAGVQAPGLSTAEREVLSSGAAATAGVGSLVIASGRQAIAAATAVAALSFEAFGAQIKVLDADIQEALGSKADAAAADQLRGLLEGSKVAGTRKSATAEQQQLFSTAPQVLGAASTALASAYNAVRSEIQSGAMPVKGGVSPNVRPPALPDVLTSAAKSLLQLASSSLGRSAAIASTITSSSTQQLLQQLAQQVQQGPLAAGQQQLSAVAGQLSTDLSAWPGLEAALLGVSAVATLHQAVAVEALTAGVALRLTEGPPPPPPAPDAPPAAAAPSRKDKQKAAGLSVGKGTGVVRSIVEAAAAAAGSRSSDATPSSSSSTLPLAGDPADVADALQLLPAALQRVAVLLAPFQAPLQKLLEEVRGVVEANQARRKPKVPKGARDFMPEQMSIREKAFAIITDVFKRHGAVGIDTPVFELRETLTGKYGEDSKLIYDLADQGGELLSLRYDLTVPFARFVAVHAITNIKRYHIGKVYRRDQPQMSRGRFREFFQCDFDVAGTYATMVADAEVLKVTVEILSDLQLGNFTVKLNHRKLLDAMLAIAGVPPQKFRAICSAIDKLDKEPWSAVRAEMTEEKGLPGPVADKIGEFVVLKGQPRQLLAVLQEPSHALSQHPESAAALAELSTLFDFLEAMGALCPISFDLSLARGLDYYTGVIYEAVLEGSNVGSIAAGGRYDKLVGMFSGKDVPAVGISIGIERVFSIMEAQAKERAAASGSKIRATDTQVLVASIGNGMQVKRMELCSQLWAAGIRAEFGFKPNPKMGDQLGHAIEECIPFMVLFGDDELKQGVVKIKDMAAKTEDVVQVADLVPALQQRLSSAATAAMAAAAGGEAV